MKKIIASVILVICFCLGAIGGYNMLKNYYESSVYWEKNYNKYQKTEDLVVLCSCLYAENDIKLLDYMQIAVQDSNFQAVCEQSTPKNEKNALYNSLIAGTIRVCIENQNIEALKKSILDFYPKIENIDKFRLVYSMLETSPTDFLIQKQNIVIDVFENMYNKETAVEQKLEVAVVIYSYYSSCSILDVDKNSEWYDIFNSTMQQMELTEKEENNWKEMYWQYTEYWNALITN